MYFRAHRWHWHAVAPCTYPQLKHERVKERARTGGSNPQKHMQITSSILHQARSQAAGFRCDGRPVQVELTSPRVRPHPRTHPVHPIHGGGAILCEPLHSLLVPSIACSRLFRTGPMPYPYGTVPVTGPPSPIAVGSPTVRSIMDRVVTIPRRLGRAVLADWPRF